MNIFTRTNDDDFLKYLSPAEQEQISAASEVITFQPGDVIVSAGDRNRDLFIITQGSAAVVLPDDQEKLVYQLKERDLIGEINFILPVRRSATVKALTEMQVIRFDYTQTMAFLADNLSVAAKLFAALNDVLAIRLVKTTQRNKNLPDIEQNTGKISLG